MSQLDLEIDISKVKAHFNRLFDSAMATIRRAVMVKDAAVDRVQSGDLKVRASGYYHLSKVIDLQLGIYGNYLERFGKVRLPKNAKEQIIRIEELDEGAVKKYFLRKHVQRFRSSISALEIKFSITHRKVSVLYQIVLNQREVLKVVPYQESGQISKEEERRIRKSRVSVVSPEEMLKFSRLLAEEELQSNELIRELKESRDIFIQALDAVGHLQMSFAGFIKSARNFRDEREQSLRAFFSKAVLVVSAYFVLKVTSVWGAEGVLNFSSDEEFKAFIFVIQHKIMLYDNLADTLAASPAVYAALKSGSLKNIVKNGFRACRQVYLEGQENFKRAVDEVLSSGRMARIPEFR